MGFVYLGPKNFLATIQKHTTANFTSQNKKYYQNTYLTGTPHFIISSNERAPASTLCLPSQSDDDWPSAWAASNPITAYKFSTKSSYNTPHTWQKYNVILK